ncbi:MULTISPECIES: hypothetical protein [Burkholderia]|uniref:hypothetical protein n=1 Tax=Burkholderia TaxID=32008 RepID=UPI00117DB23A|nr:MULTISPECIES: hypothetical protein [Burkholderia]
MRALYCAAQSLYLDIGAAMRRGMGNRMNNREVKSVNMFYVSPEALSRLLRADYLRAEMFSGLTPRFTWGKR